ncbi:MAG: enoyl-[acyl-carrier-protein] reductase FabI [Phycisphaerae bacterium]|nr:enoyl-[acyl-carrier-protein] reductase FabI [Phycisphaerae bacterium]
MGLMDGKKGLIVGVANERSYAYFIAESLLREGAECLFTHLPGDKMERRVRKACESLGVDDPWLRPLNAASDEELDSVFTDIESDHGRLDFIVHSIAFADKDWLKEGVFVSTPREVFTQACDISAYTFAAMADRAAPLMPDGGAMIAISYYGAEKAAPGYNVMGVAKSALESTTRYLATDLGPKNIRCNSISGGPFRTMSAMAVGGFGQIMDVVAERAPMRRNVEGREVGDAAVFLLSDLSTGVTGQVLYVDCGFSSIVM